MSIQEERYAQLSRSYAEFMVSIFEAMEHGDLAPPFEFIKQMPSTSGESINITVSVRTVRTGPEADDE